MEQLNVFLDSLIRKSKNVYLVDLDSIASVFGKKNVQDDHLHWLSHGSTLSDFDGAHDKNRIQKVAPPSAYYTQQHGILFAALINELISSYRTINQTDLVKMVVVDLDHTLWRGVLAEDGIQPLVVEGYPLGLAEALLILKTEVYY